MGISKRNMISKFKNEVNNLEKRKATMPASERKFVEEILTNLRNDIKKIQSAKKISDFFDEHERTNTQAMIINVLNEIEHQVSELQSRMKAGSWIMNPSADEAMEIIEQFFITCQIAEKIIKHSHIKGYVTRDQVKELNEELKRKVDRMVQLSKKSDALLLALHQSQRAQATIVGL